MDTAVSEFRPAPKPGLVNRIFRNTFRILFLTMLFTGLGMAVGLTTGILTTVISAAITHHPLDMTRAYRFFAIPSAIFVGSCAFLYQLVQTIRRPR